MDDVMQSTQSRRCPMQLNPALTIAFSSEMAAKSPLLHLNKIHAQQRRD